MSSPIRTAPRGRCRAALAVFCALTTFVAACGGEDEKGQGPGGPGGPGGGGGPPPPAQVSVVTVEKRDIPLTTELPGRTAAYLVAEVRPQVSGLILERLFEEGQDVQEGDALYQIDAKNYELALASAKASLQRAAASVSTIQTQARRTRDLVAKGILAEQQADDVTGSLRAARAEVAAARAAVDKAELDLERTKVIAPISGRIGRSTIMQGSLVTAYQATLATVQQLDPIYVDITRSSAEVLELKEKIRKGLIAEAKGTTGGETAAVKLVLEDGTPYAHDGQLKFADAQVDESTGAITLRAVFPNPDKLLLPGMYVRAILSEGVAENALLAPQQGVSRDPRGVPIAMIVNADNKVEQRELQVDRTIGDQWLVTSGLAEGDRVIVEGLQKIRPGAPAQAVPYGAPPPGAPGMQQDGAPPGGAPPGAGAKPGGAPGGGAAPGAAPSGGEAPGGDGAEAPGQGEAGAGGEGR
ncbi:MAG: efflux RND transporter periplasmic adaptor subunit [Deltaproteobacteria bacterium]|nr:efflux RND transporter periplasmic adaptor subunit [Deltaproteobacteria bacterium]